ncbi:MAG: type II toxin-antitoxin system VapC family toxin [Candidatus Binatia bacterium]
MAAYLLDTTAFSALVKENPRAKARLAALEATDRVVICTVVRGEVLYGLELMPDGRRKLNLARKINDLLSSLPCLLIPEEAANDYARIKRATERRGSRLDENDLWIAATALSLGAILVTTDSDFQRVRGLKLEDWFEESSR